MTAPRPTVPTGEATVPSMLRILMPSMYPEQHLIVGYEEDTDGSGRVYLDRRWLNLHTHIDDPSDKRRAQLAASTGKTLTDVPPENLCKCPPPEATP